MLKKIALYQLIANEIFRRISQDKYHTGAQLPTQNELAKDLGVDLDENGYIITDKNQKTNVDHVYSAGDITGGVKQWVVACGEGAVASTTAFNEMNL